MQQADLLVDSRSPLRAQNAVAALLMLEDGRYVMQLRDNVPQIFYPNHWGCFGGAVDARESPRDALARELCEELEYHASDLREFTRFDFDLSHLGQEKVFRIYFEARVPLATYRAFVLHEGARMEAIDGRELLGARKVTPYDAFAVWLHLSRGRLAGARR